MLIIDKLQNSVEVQNASTGLMKFVIQDMLDHS
jgi:hypothetical protein